MGGIRRTNQANGSEDDYHRNYLRLQSVWSNTDPLPASMPQISELRKEVHEKHTHSDCHCLQEYPRG